MPIRSEDKEFVQTLALFGALCGAFLGVIVVMHLSDRAHEQNSDQNEYHQRQAAIAKLSDARLNPDQALVNQEVLAHVQQQIQTEERPAAPAAGESFWLRIPRWGYLSLCAGGGVAGIALGYSGFWATGWAGSILIYSIIRLFYRCIRKVAPDSAAATVQAQSTQTGQTTYQRDQSRILPTLIKLCVLIMLALGVLGMVVWYLTG